MLLRRVTKHIKDQNWFAVFLDFLIVVFGVYIGVQVGNWNENKLDSKDYNELLENVIIEMNNNLRRQQFVRQGVKEELPIIQQALEDLRACRTDENALKNVQAALIPLSAPYTLLFESTALKRLINHKDYVHNLTSNQRKQLSLMHESSLYFKRFSDLQDEKTLDAFKNMNQVLRPGPLNVEGPDEILKVILSDKPLSPPLHRIPMLMVSLEEACQNIDFLTGFYNWEAAAFNNSITAGRLDKLIRVNFETLGYSAEVLPESEL